MPRLKKTLPPVDPNAPVVPKLPIATRDKIIKSFLKPDQNIHWARELASWKRLWTAYPDERFWLAQTLPFKLNHMSWFESIEGKVHLSSVWTLFHYNPPAPPQVDGSPNSLDSKEEPEYDTPLPAAPVLAPRKAKTVAELLSTRYSQSSTGSF